MIGSATFWQVFWSVFHEAVEHGPLVVNTAVTGSIDGRMRLNPGTALNFTAEVYGVSVEDILSHKREKHLLEPRMLTAQALRKIGDGWSYPAIGRIMGGRDHSTAIHLCRKAEWLAQRSARFAGALGDLEMLFNTKAEEKRHGHTSH